jgi:hypothetical protein
MIGTSTEMLLYLSYHEDFNKICGTRRTLVHIRSKLGNNGYSEEQMSEWLQLLGCTCLRESIVIPAVIIDRHGRVFDEHTFVDLFLTDTMKEDLKRKLNMDRLIVKGGYLHERALKIFLRKRKAYVHMQRYTLPSVWLYEPTYGESVSPRLYETIGRLIGNQLPR